MTFLRGDRVIWTPPAWEPGGVWIVSSIWTTNTEDGHVASLRRPDGSERANARICELRREEK